MPLASEFRLRIATLHAVGFRQPGRSRRQIFRVARAPRQDAAVMDAGMHAKLQYSSLLNLINDTESVIAKHYTSELQQEGADAMF